MKIVDLISSGDRRAVKKRQSYVRENAVLRSSCSKILSLQKGKIRARSPEGDVIAFIVSPYAGKVVATRNLTFEMIDVRGFHAWPW